MDNPMRNKPTTADAAEAEENQAAAEFGKFKDAQALWDAYTALEAEFTRRSQRLKELEAANKEREEPSAQAASGNAPSPEAESLRGAAADAARPVSDELKNAVIEEYLAGVRANRGVPFVTGGSVVAAERRTPRTLKEAGLLAKDYFDHKED